ncbi:MAG: imidazole glycerol phosphate synthase subunit HisH [Deltaproteobacteria bacterium]|nr:imidazole glycerol phosphate synthase subunit HisH [Deltaproteobacteria bacterium]
MIAIIDYDMGNLRSVQKGFERVGHDAVVTREPGEIGNASHVVLPGVGSFRECMENLTGYGLVEPIVRAIDSGKPFLGICLGLQLLFTESDEFGNCKGLDIIKGRVVHFSQEFRDSHPGLKIPHMGWNDIEIKRRPPILDGIENHTFFYFVHSYYVVPEDADVVATTTDYGGDFTSSIWKENIFACQFHPEKSQAVGLRLLKNFGNMKG